MESAKPCRYLITLLKSHYCHHYVKKYLKLVPKKPCSTIFIYTISQPQVMLSALISIPRWFFGFDMLFEILSALVPFVLAYYSRKVYQFTEQREYKLMVYGFAAIGASLLAKMISTAMIYLQLQQTQNQMLLLTYQTGFSLFRFLYLAGLVLLLMIAFGIQDRRQVMVLFFFIIMLTAFSHFSYFVFHIIAAFLLLHIVWFFYENYCKRKTQCAMLVVVSFALLALSQVAFIFINLQKNLYPIGETLQLLGFLTLLYNHVVVLKK